MIVFLILLKRMVFIKIKKIVAFFAGNVGQELITFRHDIIETAAPLPSAAAPLPGAPAPAPSAPVPLPPGGAAPLPGGKGAGAPGVAILIIR